MQGGLGEQVRQTERVDDSKIHENQCFLASTSTGEGLVCGSMAGRGARGMVHVSYHIIDAVCSLPVSSSSIQLKAPLIGAVARKGGFSFSRIRLFPHLELVGIHSLCTCLLLGGTTPHWPDGSEIEHNCTCGS